MGASCECARRVPTLMALLDADGIRAVSRDLGVGNYYPLLAAMLPKRVPPRQTLEK